MYQVVLVSRVTAVIVVVAIWGAAAAAFLSNGIRTAADDPGATSERSPSAAQPRYFDVTLDSSGRPYDQALFPGAILERRPLAVLHAPSSRLRFMGGEYAPSEADSEVVLSERPGRRYPVQAIWRVAPTKARGKISEIVGVVIVERDAPIAGWRELDRTAYGTDGGTGAIATAETPTDMATYEEISGRLLSELGHEGRQFFTADIDGFPGTDTIVFSNGYGDGGFPSIAGYDASGRRVAVVLWSVAAPWRLAFPEGTPPPQVTEREDELAACLAGKVKVYGSRCRVRK